MASKEVSASSALTVPVDLEPTWGEQHTDWSRPTVEGCQGRRGAAGSGALGGGQGPDQLSFPLALDVPGPD